MDKDEIIELLDKVAEILAWRPREGHQLYLSIDQETAAVGVLIVGEGHNAEGKCYRESTTRMALAHVDKLDALLAFHEAAGRAGKLTERMRAPLVVAQFEFERALGLADVRGSLS